MKNVECKVSGLAQMLVEMGRMDVLLPGGGEMTLVVQLLSRPSSLAMAMATLPDTKNIQCTFTIADTQEAKRKIKAFS